MPESERSVVAERTKKMRTPRDVTSVFEGLILETLDAFARTEWRENRQTAHPIFTRAAAHARNNRARSWHGSGAAVPCAPARSGIAYDTDRPTSEVGPESCALPTIAAGKCETWNGRSGCSARHSACNPAAATGAAPERASCGANHPRWWSSGARSLSQPANCPRPSRVSRCVEQTEPSSGRRSWGSTLKDCGRETAAAALLLAVQAALIAGALWGLT